MDETYIGELGAEWLKNVHGDEAASPYEMCFITPASIYEVTPARADIRCYPSSHAGFHGDRRLRPVIYWRVNECRFLENDEGAPNVRYWMSATESSRLRGHRRVSTNS
jgi:hypothetical protein